MTETRPESFTWLYKTNEHRAIQKARAKSATKITVKLSTLLLAKWQQTTNIQKTPLSLLIPRVSMKITGLEDKWRSMVKVQSCKESKSRVFNRSKLNLGSKSVQKCPCSPPELLLSHRTCRLVLKEIGSKFGVMVKPFTR